MTLAQIPVEAGRPLIEFGIAGAVILLLFGLLIYVLKDHRGERKEWRHEASQRADVQRDQFSISTAVQKELTVALSDLAVQSKRSAEIQERIREDQIRHYVPTPPKAAGT
tara:strand:+ start:8609 stop:8938 length:330 start_codon:yes stop_codon:yes gene_type:complete